MKSRIALALLIATLLAALTWLWHKTRSIDPEEHARFDSALRELRSLDRTINQDVLRARYQLVDSYMPVLRSYRRMEELEATIAHPIPYLDAVTNRRLQAAVTNYRSAATAKQDRIERFKYRSADLKELLNYLPGAGTGVAEVCHETKQEQLAQDVNHVLQLALLYNLTSDESYSSLIGRELNLLAAASDKLSHPGLKRRIRTLVTNTRRLLKVKPSVDQLLTEIFEQPVTIHEERVAAIYSQGYRGAEHTAQQYRFVLYAMSISLFLLVAWGVVRLRRNARDLAIANETLEQRVAERTRALATRNQEMRVVLDNVEQALFTVDLAGHLSRERSAALDRWFANAEPGVAVWDVFRADERAAEWLRLGWAQLEDDFLPLEAVLDQLPSQLNCSGRHYQILYIPIEQDQKLEKLLLVMSDTTERVEGAKKEAEQQELGTVFRHVLRDRAGFLEFFAEGQRLVDCALGGSDSAAVLRAIHTLKGNASMFGVVTVATVAGELESSIIEHHSALDSIGRTRLLDCWTAFAERVRSLTETATNRVEITRSDIRSLRAAIANGASSDEVLGFLREVEREPAERRLTRISEQTKVLAKRLGKGDVVVTTESNDVRLDAERWAPFWGAFVHMLRNAIDHGIEDEAERLKLGKPAVGQIGVSTKQTGDKVIVEIRDDGRGIDWDAVRQKAGSLGLSVESDEQLAELLFRGGLSTKSVVTEYSGRGTGVSACYNVCREMGGELELSTTKGLGTRVRFTLPSDDAATRSSVAA